MSRHIDTDEFLSKVDDLYSEEVIDRTARDAIECLLYDIPSADRPQGEWIKDDLGTVVCSECKRPRRDNRINHINFCNSCGARMKGADDE